MYIDLKIRQFFLDIRIWFFKRKLKKRLLKDRANLLKEMEKQPCQIEILSDLSMSRKECPKCGATWINGQHKWATGMEGSERDLAGLVCNN